jgi:prolyl-tRNA synthetase
MGCYGIGVTRTIQAAIEQSHDADGMIWPASITPYMVHFCMLDNDEKMNGLLNELTQVLDRNGIDYFIDDRDERPGVKFKDADLLGAPLRVTLGKKAFEAGQVEIVLRKTKELKKVAISEAAASLVDEAQKLLGSTRG